MAELPPVISWHIVGSVLISFTRPGAIPPEDWKQYIATLRDSPHVNCTISATWGSLSIDSLQRKAASDVVKSRGLRVIVIANDRLTRGLVTAVSWLGVDISAYSWGKHASALSQLDIPDSDRRELGRLIEVFQHAME